MNPRLSHFGAYPLGVFWIRFARYTERAHLTAKAFAHEMEKAGFITLIFDQKKGLLCKPTKKIRQLDSYLLSLA